MDTPAAVAAAAAILSECEASARTIKGKLRDLRPLFKDINDNGDAGLLITQEMAGLADTLGTSFEADLWSLHRQLTDLAKERGIDLPGIESGGGR